jgi:hypothetical protein
MVQKQTITYQSEIDAIVAISKRLCIFEERYKKSSEDFFHRYSCGELDDTADFVEWSNMYQHFLSIRSKLEKQIVHAA